MRLPRVQYPRGFKLSLNGARLISAGATLRLRGRGRPARVAVTPR